MKVAIMQPYLFPYIGYFQLINAVDVFVVYDDVNFIKKGYINRNSIVANGQKFQFTFPIIGASQNFKINELNFDDFTDKFLKTIILAYSKAPFFNTVLPIIERILSFKDRNVSKFLVNSILEICSYLQIETRIMISSELKLAQEKKSADRIISICNSLGATNYINAIGGKELYDVADFKKNNLNLQFIQAGEIQYKQHTDTFVPWLSIIDVMMFNDVSTINKLLHNYTLN